MELAPLNSISSNLVDQQQGRLSDRCAILILFGIIAFLTVMTWGRMHDPIVDFGRELYVPWQLAEGKVLYQDIAYFNGPVSPYLNTIVFKFFGSSLATLTIFNSVLLAVIVSVTFLQLKKLFTAPIALFSCICFLLIQGFGHVGPLGNYNYICPYSHEMTHGILLSILILFFLLQSNKRTWWQTGLAGICWGLVFLGKAEFFVAISGAVFVALFAPLVTSANSIRKTIVDSLTLLVSALIPIVGFWLFLFVRADASIATLGVAGSWFWIFNSNVTDLPYYQYRSGTDAIFANTLSLLASAASAIAAIIALVLIAQERSRRNIIISIGCVAAIVLMSGKLFPVLITGKTMASAIIVFTTLLAAKFVFTKFRTRRKAIPNHQKSFSHNQIHLLAWSVFASLLLLKIVLNADLFEYGFALAMPALVILIPAILHFVPGKIAKPNSRQLIRMALVVLIGLETFAYAFSSCRLYMNRSHALPIAACDMVLAHPDARGPILSDAIEYMRENCEADSTILTLPEGASINFWLKKENPSPYINFMPPEMEMFGEHKMVREFERHPSDYVLLINRDFWIYEKSGFGIPGFGDKILNWVQANYRPVQTFGATSDQPNRFGITIWKKIPVELQRSSALNY